MARNDAVKDRPDSGGGPAPRPGSRVRLPPGPWATVLDGLCAKFPAISRERWLSRIERGLVTEPLTTQRWWSGV